ncbi:unnamed protein product [Closterium sp. NIES-54]
MLKLVRLILHSKPQRCCMNINVSFFFTPNTPFSLPFPPPTPLALSSLFHNGKEHAADEHTHMHAHSHNEHDHEHEHGHGHGHEHGHEHGHGQHHRHSHEAAKLKGEAQAARRERERASGFRHPEEEAEERALLEAEEDEEEEEDWETVTPIWSSMDPKMLGTHPEEEAEERALLEAEEDEEEEEDWEAGAPIWSMDPKMLGTPMDQKSLAAFATLFHIQQQFFSSPLLSSPLLSSPPLSSLLLCTDQIFVSPLEPLFPPSPNPNPPALPSPAIARLWLNAVVILFSHAVCALSRLKPVPLPPFPIRLLYHCLPLLDCGCDPILARPLFRCHSRSHMVGGNGECTRRLALLPHLPHTAAARLL